MLKDNQPIRKLVKNLGEPCQAQIQILLFIFCSTIIIWFSFCNLFILGKPCQLRYKHNKEHLDHDYNTNNIYPYKYASITFVLLFLQLFRNILTQTLEYIKKRKWKKSLISNFTDVLSSKILTEAEERIPDGLKIHLADIYLDELESVGAEEVHVIYNYLLLTISIFFLAQLTVVKILFGDLWTLWKSVYSYHLNCIKWSFVDQSVFLLHFSESKIWMQWAQKDSCDK